MTVMANCRKKHRKNDWQGLIDTGQPSGNSTDGGVPCCGVGVELRGERSVEAGCLVGQTVEKAKRAGRVVGEKNKAADAGNLIVICFALPTH